MKPMISRHSCLGLIVLLLAVTAPAAPEPAGWSTDLAEAQARAGSRLLLVSFTGSDWCVWCKRLKDEILTKTRFQDYARENLVLVELDFPREKPLPPERARQNAALAQKYAVTLYPTLLVLNAAGEEIGRMNYMQGGPKTFVRELQRLAAKAGRADAK